METPPDEEFVRHLTSCQARLFGYIMHLLPDIERAKDVLQEANVVMWKKAAEFEPGTNFGAWASKIAFFQVMAHRSRQKRDKLIYDDELVAQLAQEGAGEVAAEDPFSDALRGCIEQLPDRQRDLLWQRYALGAPVGEIAQRLGRTAGALRVALFRIRNALLECIQRQAAEGGQS